jgi:hypothetical protein
MVYNAEGRFIPAFLGLIPDAILLWYSVTLIANKKKGIYYDVFLKGMKEWK